MPRLDLAQVPLKTGSIYPAPFAAMMAGRSSLRLGDAGGLRQFGVNLVTLDPGRCRPCATGTGPRMKWCWFCKAPARW